MFMTFEDYGKPMLCIDTNKVSMVTWIQEQSASVGSLPVAPFHRVRFVVDGQLLDLFFTEEEAGIAGACYNRMRRILAENTGGMLGESNREMAADSERC